MGWFVAISGVPDTKPSLPLERVFGHQLLGPKIAKVSMLSSLRSTNFGLQLLFAASLFASSASASKVPGWLSELVPTRQGGVSGELKCYALPYGGIGKMVIYECPLTLSYADQVSHRTFSPTTQSSPSELVGIRSFHGGISNTGNGIWPCPSLESWSVPSLQSSRSCGAVIVGNSWHWRYGRRF